MFPQFKATTRYELVEIQVEANYTSNEVKFPDQEDLRSDQTADIAIQALEVFNSTDVAFSPSNIAVITPAQLKNTFLTFYVDGEEQLFQIPANKLHNMNNFADPYVWELFKIKNRQITWMKCKATNPTGAFTGVGTAFSILLGVHYIKIPPGTIDKLQQLEVNNYQNIQGLEATQAFYNF